MTGFEIRFKDKIIYASVDKGVISTHVFYDEDLYLYIGGINSESAEHIKWYSGNIDDTDDITVKVVDVKQSSEPVGSISEDEWYLSDYNRLKQKLQKEGMI
jgi:hypothetical protein